MASLWPPEPDPPQDENPLCGMPYLAWVGVGFGLLIFAIVASCAIAG